MHPRCIPMICIHARTAVRSAVRQALTQNRSRKSSTMKPIMYCTVLDCRKRKGEKA